LLQGGNFIFSRISIVETPSVRGVQFPDGLCAKFQNVTEKKNGTCNFCSRGIH
jgi:hypothetical protein